MSPPGAVAKARRRSAAATPAAGAAEDPLGLQSRRLILDTAARLFRNEGYAATSLRDIAAACGMQAGSLYYHFASKDEIVAEVLRIGVENVFRAVRDAVAALPADAPPRQLVGTAVTAHLQALLRLQDYTSANIRIFGQVPPAVRQGHLHLRDDYERLWAGLLDRCAASGQVRPQANLHLARFFLIGAMNGTLEWYHGHGTSLKAIAAQLTGMMVDGILLPEATARPARAKAASKRRP